MSRQGKQLRSVLYRPKKIAGVMLIHPLPTITFPHERKARREKNKLARIARVNFRKRNRHGRVGVRPSVTR